MIDQISIETRAGRVALPVNSLGRRDKSRSVFARYRISDEERQAVARYCAERNITTSALIRLGLYLAGAFTAEQAGVVEHGSSTPH